MITINPKQMFFNADKVLRAVDGANRRALNHIGGYVRSSIRNSIKQKPNNVYSDPGTPPHTHTGWFKQNIYYGYDAAAKTVVIGPWKSPEFHQLHEYGGVGKKRRGRGRKRKYPKYPARPYMKPALERSIPALQKEYPEQFKKGWIVKIGD